MENVDSQEPEPILSEIDWENLLKYIQDPSFPDPFPDAFDLSAEPPAVDSAPATSDSSPASDPSWFGRIEHFLLDDDADRCAVDGTCVLPAGDFFSDVLLLVPDDRVADSGSGETLSPEPNSSEENVEKERSAASEGREAGDGDDDDDTPLSKKRRRQMRNRVSAMRSRERKKLHMRDLELKSKYLEGECKRLQYALNCCLMENQILHQQLQSQKACRVSLPKQESAVLSLESLPLGSLLWVVSMSCLFLAWLPRPLLVILLTVDDAVSLGRGSNALQTPAPLVLVLMVVVRKPGSELALFTFELGRRFKAARTKMKGSMEAWWLTYSQV